jgi:hypothetical protein
MFFANRESIPGRNNLSISRTSKYSMDLRLYLLFSNIDIEFQIKTLNSMRLHNNKDSTKVLFTSQLQTEQFHTPLSLLLIILIFCVGCVCLSSSCVLCTQCYQYHWIIHSWLTHRFYLTLTYAMNYAHYWIPHRNCKSRTAMNVLLFYFNLCLRIMLYSRSCLFKYVSVLTYVLLICTWWHTHIIARAGWLNELGSWIT